MAILQALLAYVLRQAGSILNTCFGWATQILFGKVPQSKQYLLTAVSFGSVIWLVVLLGILFPVVGSFILAFAVPKTGHRELIRLIMLIAALIIPAVVGVCTLFLTAKDERPQGFKAKAVTVLKGYPYTLGLAVTLIMMVILAPVMKVIDIAKRWDNVHIPVLIDPPDYEKVVDAVQHVLAEHGYETQRAKATWMLRAPTKVLTTFASGAVKNLVSENIVELHAAHLRVQLHPSDLIVHGKEKDINHVHAVLAEFLTFTPAHLTWTKEANRLEDELLHAWHVIQREEQPNYDLLARALDAVEEALHRIDFDFDEWDVLFREKLLVQEMLLKKRAGLSARPETAGKAEVGKATARAPRQRTPERPRERGPLGAAIAAVIAVLSLGDVLQRRRPA